MLHERTDVIVQEGGRYYVYSETTPRKKLGGPYATRAQAEKRLAQVEFFKAQRQDLAQAWGLVRLDDDQLDANRQQIVRQILQHRWFVQQAQRRPIKPPGKLPKQLSPKTLAVDYAKVLIGMLRRARDVYQPLLDALKATKKDSVDDEPRDEHGRWTGGFEGDVHPETKARIEKTMHALAADYPSIAHIKIKSDKDLSTRGVMGTKSKTALHLNHDYLNDPAKLAQYEKDWHGLQVDPTIEGIVTHEMGHILDNQVLAHLGTRRYEALRKEHGLSGTTVEGHSPSVYGQEHFTEMLAEAFVADRLGRVAHDMHEDLAKPALERSRKIWDSYRKVLDPNTKVRKTREGQRRKDAGDDDKLSATEAKHLLDEAGAKLKNSVDRSQIDSLASKFAARTSTYQRVQLGRQVRSALGVDPFLHDRALNRQRADFVAKNVSLITRIPTRLHEKVEGLVMNSLDKSDLNKTLASTIADQFGIAEKHARLIARDQISKFYGAVNKSRQKELGVSKFIWRTVEDGRVREEHADLDGHEFSWDDLPTDDDGEEIYPGSPIQCRCSAEPVLDDIVSDVDDEEDDTDDDDTGFEVPSDDDEEDTDTSDEDTDTSDDEDTSDIVRNFESSDDDDTDEED